MPQTVYPDLASFGLKRANDVIVDAVAQRNKVPGRLVPSLAFEDPQQVHIPLAGIGFHIVCQHQRPRSPSRPQVKERHRNAGKLDGQRE